MTVLEIQVLPMEVDRGVVYDMRITHKACLLQQ